MTTHLEAAIAHAERDNDYFTSTIVGMPVELTLGRAYTKRKLSHHPTITVDAVTAEVWHSDAARELLNRKIKKIPKAMALFIASGDFVRSHSERFNFLSFFLGFGLCAVLCLAYLYQSEWQPWLQKLLDFRISA